MLLICNKKILTKNKKDQKYFSGSSAQGHTLELNYLFKIYLVHEKSAKI